MNAIHKTLVLIIVALTTGGVSAFAGTAQGQAASGAAAQAAAPMHEVQGEGQTESESIIKQEALRKLATFLWR